MISKKNVILLLAVGALIMGASIIPFHGVSLPGPDAVLAADGDKPADGEAKKEGEEGQAGQPCPECPECPDVAKVVLRGLEEKKQSIEAAQKALNQQRKELETYEAQIDEKLAQLTAVRDQVKEDMARLEGRKTQEELAREDAYETKMDRLVKMYAGMKPKSAALIVDKMELEVAQEIFMRMREPAAAQILSFVDSDKAAKISERLAFRKK